MVDEHDVLGNISALVEAEHLRERFGRGELTSDEEHAQLTSLEQQLDQCWDLLRQRRARASAGQNLDEAQVRPVGQVEGYLDLAAPPVRGALRSAGPTGAVKSAAARREVDRNPWWAACAGSKVGQSAPYHIRRYRHGPAPIPVC